MQTYLLIRKFERRRATVGQSLTTRSRRNSGCGVKQRYDGTFTGTLVEGAGVTAKLLMENGFRVIDVEDL